MQQPDVFASRTGDDGEGGRPEPGGDGLAAGRGRRGTSGGKNPRRCGRGRRRLEGRSRVSGRLCCDVCGARERLLLAQDGFRAHICNDCFERLDRLDREHVGPAFLFADAILRNRDAARMEGIG